MSKRSSVKVVCMAVLAVAAVVLFGFVGVRMWHRHNAEQEVTTALATEDRIARMEAFAHLRDAEDSDALAALVKALDDPDPKIHSRAGSALAMFNKSLESVTPALTAHLKSSPYSDVRLSCAIMLMEIKSPETHAAYLHALHDTSDKVVEIASTEIPARATAGDAEALYAVIDHPTWNVRLEICKALIRMNKADQRVVSTLEAMRKEPEAAKYDAEIDYMDKVDKEVGGAGQTLSHWGKLDTILQQARTIAAKG